MMTQFSLLITGWACPGEQLSRLATLLPSSTEWFDFHSVDRDASPGMPPVYAQAVARKIQLHDQPVRLMGWSTGALLALEVAAKWPDWVQDLVLINGTARFTRAEGYAAGVDAEQLDSLRAAVKTPDQCERALARFMMQTALPHRLDRHAVQQRVEAALGLGIDRLIDGLTYLRDTDLRSLLPTVPHPVFLLHGADDAVIPIAAAHWMADMLPQATLHVEPDMGHDWPLRSPDRIVALLQNPYA